MFLKFVYHQLSDMSLENIDCLLQTNDRNQNFQVIRYLHNSSKYDLNTRIRWIVIFQAHYRRFICDSSHSMPHINNLSHLNCRSVSKNLYSSHSHFLSKTNSLGPYMSTLNQICYLYTLHVSEIQKIIRADGSIFHHHKLCYTINTLFLHLTLSS